MSEFERQPWIEDARALLDQSAQTLDAGTLSRLNRARQAALERRRPRVARWWLPIAGLAGSCALVIATVAWHPPKPIAKAPIVAAANADAVDAGDDGIEFYQDLEFYAWLDAQEQDGDG